MRWIYIKQGISAHVKQKNTKIPWFKSKTFIVTGGSSGIGLAISRQLAKEGAKIIAVSYNPKEFPKAQALLGPAREDIEFVKCDITDSEDRGALKQLILERNLELAGLINVAGITTYGPFFDTPAVALHKVMDVNFTGTLLFTRELFPLVLANKPGELKYLGFVSSTSGGAPMANIGPYPATKAGVEMFLHSLALEFPKNVKYLTIRPGPVKTNLYENVESVPDYDIKQLLNYSKKFQILPEDVAKVYVAAMKRKRAGIIYPNFGTRMMVGIMGKKWFGRFMVKGLDYQVAKGK